MSCQECNDFQDSDKTSFFRWKNANIEVRACKKHMIEIYDVLREAQRKRSNENTT